jgi:hypothetical protein
MTKDGLKRYGDQLERVTWAGLETAGAAGIVAVARNYLELEGKWWVLITIGLTVLLAAGKTSIATNIGNGSAALGLPVDAEPVPAESVALTVARAVGDEQLAEGEVPEPPLNPRDLDGDGHDDNDGRFVAH